MNPLAQLTMVLDPATGDLINGKGYGNITLSLQANEDMKMYGNYEIEDGDYTFTFRKLFFVRNFKINSGSRIAFNGPLDNTNLNINAIYTTKARLLDLLDPITDLKAIPPGSQEEKDVKIRQNVNVLLNMRGSLDQPILKYNIEVPDSRMEGTVAGVKLTQINQNEAQLFDNVASLLLIGTFIPSNFSSATAQTAATNNLSDIFSSTVSSQLSNIVGKLLGDPDLSIELKYNTYNYNDQTSANNFGSRNELTLGVRKNFLKDRLIVELGGAYDWGRPTTTNSSTSNLNLAGDFRAQYLLTQDGRVRLNVFRTSSYDVLLSANNNNIYRGGIGISYRKSFNNLKEFFGKPIPPNLPQPKDSINNSANTQNKTTSL